MTWPAIELTKDEVRLVEQFFVTTVATAHLGCGVCGTKIEKEFKDVSVIGRELYESGWRVKSDPVLMTVCPMCSLNLGIK